MKTKSILLLLALLLAACSTKERVPPAPTALSTPLLPAATAAKLFPTPSSPGDSIVWDGLRVTFDRLELTQDYLTEFGSTRTPPQGSQFLWVHVWLKNTGPIEMDLPPEEHFSILYAAIELKPTYGHRAGHIDFTTLGPVIFPDEELEGWLRFDIPITAELSELRFVFLPESSQVGASYSSPNYPYADDKPTYVWNCRP